MDITDLKRTEQALRESEARFRLALKNAPASVAAQDRDLRFLWAYDQRSVKPSDVIGRTDADVFAPEDAAWLTDLKRGVLLPLKEKDKAMGAMREDGQMDVSLDEVEIRRGVPPLPAKVGPGCYLKLTVTDTGHGMSRDVLKKIFDPFFTTKKPGEFDLVLTDQTMPGMTGEKLAREILSLRPGIPVILATGFSEVVQEADARSLGIREFILKPFSVSEISDKIRRALAKA